MSRVDDGFASLRLDALPDVVMNKRPAGYIVDPVRLAFEDPEDCVASRMDEALEGAAVPLEVDQHRCVDLVPVPGIVLMVLVECFDLAVIRIEPEHRRGVEIVAGVGITRPRCGVADAPINCLGVWIVVACHPGRSAARFPVVAFPCVVAWLALARDGEGPPQLLAAIGVERDDVTTAAEFI